jgi:hypothetical protein
MELHHCSKSVKSILRRPLVDWLVALDGEKWNEEISRDFSPGGRGTKMLDEIDGAIDSGDFKPLG